MSKKQDWGSGTWTCMIPGGQQAAYAPETAGYKATFTVDKLATQLNHHIDTQCDIYSSHRQVVLRFKSSRYREVKIQVVNLAGQKKAVYKTSIEIGENSITLPTTLESGLYIVNVKTDQEQFNKKIVLR